MPIGYAVSDGDLVVRDGRGVRWRGRPDGHPVARVVQVPAGRDAIVLLDYDTSPTPFSNVLRVDPSGEVKWRAAPPESDDAWVAMRWEKRGGLSANSWSCFYCKLDPETGSITSSTFTK